MTGVDPDAPVPPERGAKPRECRGVPSLHDNAGTTAVQSQNRSTNRGHRHATYEPNSESAATAECATVFGQLGVLSGKSRLKVLIVGVGEPSFYVTLYEDGMSFTNLANSGRFSVTKLGNLESNDPFWLQSADELIEGLKRNQKFIPIEFLYDDLGSELFDKMVDSEEYYLPHKEKEILRKFGPKIVELTKECDIYELGSGSAKKTSILLRCYRDSGYSFTFYPIDINQSIMEKGAGELNNILPDIPINCIVGTFEQALTEMKAQKNKRMVLFIGSTISQLRNDDLIHLLYTVLEPGEFVLVGYDLYKSPEILKAAYQNIEVENANKNALSCINKYFNGNFELQNFELIVIYNSNEQRCETHLRSLTDHVVHIKHLGLTLELKSGETICTGYQRKFTIAEVRSRFAKAGFKDVEAFTDDQNWYAMTLFQANHAGRNLGR